MVRAASLLNSGADIETVGGRVCYCSVLVSILKAVKPVLVAGFCGTNWLHHTHSEV